MSSCTPFRTDSTDQPAAFTPREFTPATPSPSDAGSPFGSGNGSPFSGTPATGPLRPRRRGIGPGTIIVATLVPVIAAVGIFVYADRSAERARTSLESSVEDSVQQILDQNLPASGRPVVAASTPVPARPAPAGDVLVSGDALGSIVEQVARARGAGMTTDDLRMVSASLYPTYASFSAQDPAIPGNIDNFTWRAGTVGDAMPVQLIGDGDLEESLFGAGEIDWNGVATLVAEAPEAVSVEGGEVTHVMIDRALPFSSQIRVRVFVSGSRDSGYVDGAADGTMISINGN